MTREEVPPIALVVEDRADYLETRLQLLQQYGFTAVGAEDEHSALRELRAIPAIDIVITDINLDAKRPFTKAGIDLAIAIKTLDSDLPVIGYSGAFAERDLDPSETQVFDDRVLRGATTGKEIVKHIESWMARASAHRQRRTEWAASELERLRNKYGSPNPDFLTLRSLRPTSEGKPKPGGISVEESLNQAGYRLQIIEPGTSRPTFLNSGASVISPLLAWLKNEEDVFVAEIYGYPELYAYGDSEGEAVSEVLLLMDGFHKELVIDAPEDSSLSPLTRRLRDFLKHVFG
jgi:CheY-like chemotaxis protein